MTGGQIISGQGSPEIEVSWDQPDITGEVSYTVRSLIDSLCEGESGTFDVRVESEFLVSIEELIPVNCSGF